MGQTHTFSGEVPQNQRIRPTPGTSGRKNRKGTVSVYCEDSCKIFTVNVDSGMTVLQLKKSLPEKGCEIWQDGKELPDEMVLESGVVGGNSVFRMVNRKKASKSLSTVDSSNELDGGRIIGPKKQELEQPAQPNHESLLSNSDDIGFVFNLKDFAVPDIKLNVSKKEKTGGYVKSAKGKRLE
jgi:hypothetical protein